MKIFNEKKWARNVIIAYKMEIDFETSRWDWEALRDRISGIWDDWKISGGGPLKEISFHV